MNQHNRSSEEVKREARHGREQNSPMNQKFELPDEDRQTGGAVFWLVVALTFWLIAGCFIAGNRYFERAEKHVEGIEMEAKR